MKIRLLNNNDIAEFKKLLRYSLEESPMAFSDSPTEVAAFDDDYYLKRLAVVGDPPESFVLGAFDPHLQAMLTYRRDQRIKARHKSTVYSMYVHPNCRNSGVGSGLMKELFHRAESLVGLEQIHVWVMNSERTAREFYIRLGFQPSGLVRKDLMVNGRYVDSEYLVRYLTD